MGSQSPQLWLGGTDGSSVLYQTAHRLMIQRFGDSKIRAIDSKSTLNFRSALNHQTAIGKSTFIMLDGNEGLCAFEKTQVRVLDGLDVKRSYRLIRCATGRKLIST